MTRPTGMYTALRDTTLAWWLWGPGSLEREVRKRARKAAREDFARETRRWD